MYWIPCPSRDIYKENLVTAWFAFFFFNYSWFLLKSLYSRQNSFKSCPRKTAHKPSLPEPCNKQYWLMEKNKKNAALRHGGSHCCKAGCVIWISLHDVLTATSSLLTGGQGLLEKPDSQNTPWENPHCTQDFNSKLGWYWAGQCSCTWLQKLHPAQWYYHCVSCSSVPESGFKALWRDFMLISHNPFITLALTANKGTKAH